jgi:fused signal recognition particle receptor
MFNWFRRKQEDQEEQKTTPVVETQTEDKKEEITSHSPTVDNQQALEWAKAAARNIKKQKEQQAKAEVEKVEEITPEVTSVEQPTESIETEEKPVSEESTTVVAEEKIVEQTTEEVAQPEAETKTKTPTAPAWMQKSDRLEALKETAIEEELDEDFVWSAKVLAEQGRTPDDVSEQEFAWLKKLRQGLGKTRLNVINQLKSILGQGPLNADAVSEIEYLLLSADVGIEATDYIIETLQNKLKEEALPPEEAIAYLKEIIQQLLDEPLKKVKSQGFEPEEGKLNIWLLTGVNGVGKTTTIGKIAHLAKTSGYECVIAAADTFRAAAVEQVKVWGERTNTTVIANQGQNTDPAAVVFDAITSAQANNADILLVDTAGRLQNKKNLMAELSKIRRIIDNKAENAHIESLLVLDATLGQNGLRQAQVFAEAAQLTGVILTKLDGTAKGGVALAISQQLNLPIRFIGAGEGIEDLRPFSSYEFVEALLSS